MKWLIALGMIGEEQRKAIEKASKEKSEPGETYVLEKGKIAHYT